MSNGNQHVAIDSELRAGATYYVRCSSHTVGSKHHCGKPLTSVSVDGMRASRAEVGFAGPPTPTWTSTDTPGAARWAGARRRGRVSREEQQKDDGLLVNGLGAVGRPDRAKQRSVDLSRGDARDPIGGHPARRCHRDPPVSVAARSGMFFGRTVPDSPRSSSRLTLTPPVRPLRSQWEPEPA